MPDTLTIRQPEFSAAFKAHEAQVRVSAGKVASALVAILMPAGVSLDYFVIQSQPHRFYFLWLRILCSILAGFLWYLHMTSFAKKHYKVLGLPLSLG